MVSPARRALQADAMDIVVLYPLHDSVCGDSRRRLKLKSLQEQCWWHAVNGRGPSQ
jgi:hypothetical protein